jgi:hypothetical protein
MKRLFKAFLIPVFIFGLMMPISYNSGGGSSADKNFIISKAEAKKKKKKKAIAPIQISGTGKTATQLFTLQKGVSIFEITHTGGESNFAVTLMKSNGEWVDLLVNEIGEYSGKRAIGIEKSGSYLLDIEADGNWTVNITQPRPTSGLKKPQTFTGKGDSVPQFLYFKKKGLVRFNMSHDGESNFAIWLMNGNGGLVYLLVNEIGSFSGSTAVRIPKKGVYLLDITADGNWSVNVN